MSRPNRPSRYAPDNLAPPVHWGRDAACRGVDDPDVFFPAGGEGLTQVLTAEAKSYCQRCPVRPSCLAGALERREPHGVWGGMDEDERRALLRRGAAAVQQTAGGRADAPASAA
ncbi:WhiB family transcriptional regulator [Streptomyces sp. SRF1]|uniref:WhiB family transcriptional regulator n=1 Tax=Streptomyces sp. SRF1 TaxID=1549642 RepID=UPI0025AFFA66|nr:WhiB family transcriptional regulator [Streptomyces sp. SRF1]MDN3056911.1 WhiB family transcriptional regulator [Streptomyces sp. SRF1]